MTDSPSPFPVELRSLAVVDARGADAATFLQGQLTNDIMGRGASRACLAGYCSPKGRLLALMLVLPLPDGGLRLLLPRDVLDALLQRLRMFVLRADVVFEPREELRCVGWMAPESNATGDVPLTLDHGVSGLPDVPPADVLDVLGGSDGAAEVQLLRWHDASAPAPCRRYLMVASSDAYGGAGAEVAPDGSDSGIDDAERLWRLGDISAGLPRILAATRDAFVPQMINLQHIDALSFRKGCYPGQEIVARMQYLGKLKRHMRRFRVAGDAVLVSPGDALGAEDEGDAGRVVDAVTTGDGTELLAVVRIGVEPAALRLHGQPLEALPLPYALPLPEAPARRSADAAGD